MTKVLLDRRGDEYALICVGHANTVETCASVSTLCYTLAGYLRNIKCEIKDIRLESGDVFIRYKGKGKEARAAYEMTLIGFLSLEHSYPDAVTVIREKDKTFLRWLSEKSEAV